MARETRFRLLRITAVLFKRLWSENRACWKNCFYTKDIKFAKIKSKKLIIFFGESRGCNLLKMGCFVVSVFKDPYLRFQKQEKSECHRQGCHTYLTASCQLSSKII